MLLALTRLLGAFTASLAILRATPRQVEIGSAEDRSAGKQRDDRCGPEIVRDPFSNELGGYNCYQNTAAKAHDG